MSEHSKPEARPPETKRAPDYDGRWRVWRVPLDLKPATLDQTAALGTWLADCPGMHHAFWRCWSISLIHLRDIPGVRPATKQRPDATHEVISAAIDPSTAPSTESPLSHAIMRPIVQFKSPSDELALRVMHAAARAIASCMISPDSDYRTAWELWLQGTADCFASGGHPVS